MLLPIIVLGSALLAQRPPHPSFAPVTDTPGMPRVLLLGDSISMSYTLPVRKLLEGRANVHRPADNCRSTRYTLTHIEEFLGSGRWEVIHFNWGIHDVTYLDAGGKATTAELGSRQVPIGEYRANLEKLMARLHKTGAALLWCSTTPVGDNAKNRRPADVVRYNHEASTIMQRQGIAGHDLFSAATEDMLNPDGVHFTPTGAESLARRVAAVIEEALSRRPR